MIFGRLYDQVLSWATHRHAPWYLGGLSFAESSFFPIPPDVLLAPMSLARPRSAMHYALITTVASVVGGLAGYLIGMWALGWIEPWLQRVGYWDNYLVVRGWFAEWGALAVLVAGFSPVPYKLFTIAAGALAMSLPAFVLMSALGRGARFFLVAGLIMWGGEAMERRLRRNVEVIGWAVVALAVIAYVAIRW